MATVSDITVTGPPSAQGALSPVLQKFRQENPAYAAWDDERLARGLYKKFYAAKMTEDEFYQKIGLRERPGLGERLGNWFGAAGLGAAQGATFGFSDEAEAGLRSIFDEGTYTDYLAEARARYAKARERNPTAFAVGDIAGSVAVPSFGMGAAMKLPTALARYGSLAALGAGYGGLAGAGYAKGGISERLPSAVAGAAVGAITAPAAGALFSWLGKQMSAISGTRDLGREAAMHKVIGEIQQSPFAKGAQMTADDAVAEAQRLIGVARDAGMEQSALIDLSLRLRQLYTKAARTGMAGVEAAQEFAEGRAGSMGQDIAGMVDDVLGNPPTLERALERVAEDEATWKPLFAAADPKPIPTAAMGALPHSPQVIQGLNDARDLIIVLDGTVLPPFSAGALPDQLPTSVWHKAARYLDARGRFALKSGGGDAVKAGVYFKAADQIQQVLGGLNEDYVKAITAFAPEGVRRQATKLGQEMLVKKVNPEAFISQLSKLIADPQQADAVLTAVKTGLADTIAAKFPGAKAAAKLAEDNVQAMLSVVLQPEELAKLNTALGITRAMGRTTRAVGGITSAVERGDVLGDMLESGRIPLTPQGWLSRGVRAAVSRLGGIKPDVAQHIQQMLQATGPDQAKLFEALQAYLASQAGRTAPLNMGMAVGGRAIPGLLGATGGQY